MEKRGIILAAGGTGGHVFPAVATAEALIAKGHAPVLVGDARTLRFVETVAIIKEGKLPLITIAAESPSGTIGKKIRASCALLHGTWQAWRLLGHIKPAVVAGFGGYPSFPTLVAAKLRGIPIIIHEQNAVLGKANRFFARWAQKLALSFPETARIRPNTPSTITGNPVRGAIRATAYQAPADDIHLLVVGGSLGAKIFTSLLPPALAALPEEVKKRLKLVQQAKAEDIQSLTETYKELGITAELAAFFNDMPHRLAWAHLVVARAGASTISELLLAARPSILIPYPHAADRHQHANAASMLASDAAAMLDEGMATPEMLTSTIRELLDGRLTAMSSAAQKLARADAAEQLAELVLAEAKSYS